MESREEVYARVLDFFNFLKGTNYQNVLVVTHNTPTSILQNIIENKKEDSPLLFKNAEVKKFEI